MGILCNVFVAKPSQALAYRGSPAAAGIEVERFGGFTELEFGTLWAILEGVDWDVKRHMPERLWRSEDGESWICRFPDPLVTLLADASDGAIAAAAAKWAATDEISGDAATTQPIIEKLHRLASSARSTGREVYQWGSL